MKILLAADGSKNTKKALAFLATHESLCGEDDELVVVHVQPPMPPRVKSMLGAQAVADYQADEAEKVLAPVRRFLDRHPIRYRCDWMVGPTAETVLKSMARHKVHLAVLGTRGQGALGRALLGSVAQKVLEGADVPVLLVK